MAAAIKVLIVDDHPVLRRGLRLVIEPVKKLEVVGEAENGEEALKLIKTLRPEIILLDIDMPVLDGIETAKIINKDYPKVKIIFLSMHKDKDFLQSLKKLRVKGYVLKDSAVVEIANCINEVAAGKIFISEEISKLNYQPIEETAEAAPLFSVLTATEMRILRLIAESKTNKEIAGKLFISIRTVENHRFNICSKLKISGNQSLLKFAIENRKLIIDRPEEK